MSDQLRVDLERFRSFVPRFEELKARAMVDKWALTQGLDSEGECWGADEVGATFASKYVPAAEETIEAIGALAQLFDVIGEKVAHTADNLDQTDTGFARRLGGTESGSGF